jgi:hypothetical protein
LGVGHDPLLVCGFGVPVVAVRPASRSWKCKMGTMAGRRKCSIHNDLGIILIRCFVGSPEACSEAAVRC